MIDTPIDIMLALAILCGCGGLLLGLLAHVFLSSPEPDDWIDSEEHRYGTHGDF